MPNRFTGPAGTHALTPTERSARLRERRREHIDLMLKALAHIEANTNDPLALAIATETLEKVLGPTTPSSSFS